MKKGSIYALLDPESQEPRYVGQTVRSLSDRLAGHLHAAETNDKLYVCRWIKSLQVPPLIVVLEEVVEKELDAAERRWIKTMRADGARLCNLTEGGGGRLGYRLTTETRAKMSASAKIRGMPRETIEKGAASRRGKPMQRGPEWLLNVTLAARKRPLGNGNNRLGTHHTPETRAKMSASQLKRKPIDAETRAKMSASAKSRIRPRIPCEYCGRNTNIDLMKRHIQARHTKVENY
jgi:group I intron endonuclease